MEKLFRWAGVGVFVAVAGGGLFVVESHASQPALIVLVSCCTLLMPIDPLFSPDAPTARVLPSADSETL